MPGERMSRLRPAVNIGLALVIAGACGWIYSASRSADPRDPGYRIDGPALSDRYGRLASYPGKIAVECPSQDSRTAVILAMGQSNIGNHAQQPSRSAFSGQVLGFYQGLCMEASSPLLGASGTGGEWLTLLGDALIGSGRYDKVVIVPAAVGGQRIKRFAEEDLGDMLDETAASISARYRVTHALWHQGESDFAANTPPEDYDRDFLKILERLRRHGVHAPVFVSIATYCQPMSPWRADNPIERAQRALPDKKLGLWPGVDSDAFDQKATRFDDCHLSGRGEEDAAAAMAKAIDAYDLRGN